MKFLYSSLLLLLVIPALSQGKITLGYFSSDGDSVKQSAELLAAELTMVIGEPVPCQLLSASTGASVILTSGKNIPAFSFSFSDAGQLRGLGAEGFIIKGKKERIFIVGNSAMAVQHGVSQFLYTLGYRYYFPLEEWFIRPQKIKLDFKINIVEKPFFNHRYLWYGFGPGTAEVENRFQFWTKMNCLGGSLRAEVGHAYDQIVDRNKEQFLKNPDWIVNRPSHKTLPDNPKFNIANEDLVKFIIADTRSQLQQHLKGNKNGYKMITLSPSDGIGICNTPACQKMGSVTDRAFYLVNTVAKNIKKDFPAALIGCLAYSEYISPPGSKVEDNVYVALTTAFNNSTLTLTELISEWRKKVKRLGIYDYQALYAWDYDLPGQSLASGYQNVAGRIHDFAKRGATGYEAEINTGWVGKGLGYYLTAHSLWNPYRSHQKIIDEFFKNCFSTSANEVLKLYREWGTYSKPFISKADIGRWIDVVLNLMAKEKDPSLVKRLQSIASYIKYVAVYNNYKADGSEANLAFLLDEAKKNMNDESLTYYPAMLVFGGKYPGFQLNDVIKDNLARPFQADAGKNIQWLKDYRKGITETASFEKAPVVKNLATLSECKSYSFALHDIGEDMNSFTGTTYFVFEKKSSSPSFFEIQADFAEGGGIRPPVIISVYPFTGMAVNEEQMPLAEFRYTERKKWIRFKFSSLKKGVYVLKVNDHRKGFQIRLSADMDYSLFIPENTKLEMGYAHNLYFYVPAGTKSLIFMKSLTMRLFDPNGKEYDYVNNKQEEIEIKLGAGQAGIWRLMGVAGAFTPKGVYPFFGITPCRMLYPVKE